MNIQLWGTLYAPQAAAFLAGWELTSWPAARRTISWCRTGPSALGQVQRCVEFIHLTPPRITASSRCALLGYTTTCKNFIVTLTNHALFRMACCLFLHPERPTRQNLGLPRWSPTHGGTQVSAHFTWRLPVALSRLGPILPASMHGDMSILCHLSHLHLSMRMCALFVSIVCAVFHRVAPRCTGVWCAG